MYIFIKYYTFIIILGPLAFERNSSFSSVLCDRRCFEIRHGIQYTTRINDTLSGVRYSFSIYEACMPLVKMQEMVVDRLRFMRYLASVILLQV